MIGHGSVQQDRMCHYVILRGLIFMPGFTYFLITH